MAGETLATSYTVAEGQVPGPGTEVVVGDGEQAVVAVERVVGHEDPSGAL